MNVLSNAPLGKVSRNIAEYQPDLLYFIPRGMQRQEIGIETALPFYGNDIWNAFEISWLNAKGKPVVAAGTFIVPCTTENIIESKSFKLYLNSLNNTKFDSWEAVKNI